MRITILASAVAAVAAVDLSVNVDTSSGAFTIALDGSTWFSSGPYALSYDGSVHVSGGSLTLSGSAPISGSDVLGSYTGTELQWQSGSYITRFKTYSAASTIIFEQYFPTGFNSTALSMKQAFDDQVSSFPSLLMPTADNNTGMAYVSWQSCMCPGHVGNWDALTTHANYGRQGGVLTIFNQSLTAVSISAASNFMVGGLSFPSTLGANAIAGGLMGTVDPIPAGFTHRTIMVAGQGVNDTMFAWGSSLLALGGKTRPGPDVDMVVSKLSYWTDNGAYYYYMTEPNVTYEQTMLDVKKYQMETLNLPISYFQFDSWWYWKLPNKGALLLWEPMPSVFPDGLAPWLGMPLTLHNRYFADYNNYTEMGYTFLREPGATLSLPIDQSMFEYIMGKTKAWGMIQYEQDWLITTYEGLNVTQRNVTAAHDWLMAMSNAAQALNITIQYCMPLPNHMLHSTLSQSVTNARASGDYHPGTSQWDIGLSSLFYWSIGIAPSKDDWWTTEVQPNSPYGDKPTEPNWQLQAIVITLSTGPNGPSDMVGATNASLVMSTIRGDGYTLKPDRPAIMMDSAMTGIFSPTGTVENVWSTWSAHAGGAYRWNYLLSIDISAPFTVALADLGAPPAVTEYAVFNWFDAASGSILMDASTPYVIATGTGQPSAPSAAVPIRYHIVAPVMPSGWILYGEVGKIVPMAAKRVSNLVFTADGFTVSIAGATAAQNEPNGTTFMVVAPAAVEAARAAGGAIASGASMMVTCPAQATSTLSCSTSAGGCKCA